MSSVIVNERVCGVLHRYHPDENSPEFTAVWLVADGSGEIKGLVCSHFTKSFVMDFGAWARAYLGKLVARVAEDRLATMLRRFGFIELKKE